MFEGYRVQHSKRKAASHHQNVDMDEIKALAVMIA